MIKPKRKLKDFDFSDEDAHIALVHKEQGGAANGYSTLIIKAVEAPKEESKQQDDTDNTDNNGGEAEQAQEPTSVTTNKATEAVNKEEESMTTLTAEQVEALQKQVELEKSAQQAKEVELQKALEALELYKAKEQELIKKSRMTDLTTLVGDEQAEKLYKSVGALDDEAFTGVLDVLKAQAAAVENSPMFKEQGSKENGVEVAKAAQPNAEAAALQKLLAAQKQ